MFCERGVFRGGKDLSINNLLPGRLTVRSLRSDTLTSGAAGRTIDEDIGHGSSSIKGRAGSNI